MNAPLATATARSAPPEHAGRGLRIVDGKAAGMARVLALANQKGGVAKTTSTVNLAAALVEAGRRVLVVDLDPQSNLTMSQGFDPEHLERSMYDVLVHKTPIEDIVKHSEFDLAVASIDLAGAELALSSMIGRERALDKALLPVRGDYDYVLIDTPPSLGLITINALTASDGVIVPVQCEYLSLRGLVQLEATLQMIRENLNPRVAIVGILPTMYDSRLAARAGGDRDPDRELRGRRVRHAYPEDRPLRGGAGARPVRAPLRPERARLRRPTGRSRRRCSRVTKRRASMRQGPIADLFRSTEERARDQEPAGEAVAPAGSADEGRAGSAAPMPEAPVEGPRRLEAVPAPSDHDPHHAPLPYTPRAQDTSSYLASIRVVGVGGAGLNAISRMMDAGIEGVEFVALNTDVQQLAMSDASVKLQLGQELTRGLGSGSDSEVGKRSAEAASDKVRQALRGSDLVFVTAGEGGGTGTGAAPVVARIARELGALTVGIVTMPFRFEGSRRREIADDGLERLQAEVDTLIVVPNDRLLEVLDRGVSMVDAFRVADDVLRQGVQGICDLITRPGVINLDFADVRTVMQRSGSALMGIGMATGPSRAVVRPTRRALDSPLIGQRIHGATGRPALDHRRLRPDACTRSPRPPNVVRRRRRARRQHHLRDVRRPDLGDQVWVTVIATGFEHEPGRSGRARASRERSPAARASRFDDDLDVPSFLRGE